MRLAGVMACDSAGVTLDGNNVGAVLLGALVEVWDLGASWWATLQVL